MKGFFQTGLLLIISIIILSTILVLKTNKFFLSSRPIFQGPILSRHETTNIDTVKILRLQNNVLKREVTLTSYKSEKYGSIHPLLINSKIYYLEGGGLYLYDPVNQLQSLVYTLVEDNIYYNLKSDGENIYISFVANEERNIHYIEKISLKDNTATSIGPFIAKPDSKIEFMGNIANRNIFINTGTNECQIWEDIYELKNGALNKIDEYGKGCSSLAQIISYDKNGIYYAQIDSNVYQAGKGNIYKSIHYNNLVDNENIEITSLNGLEETYIQKIFYNPKDQLIFAKTVDDLLIFNTKNGELKIIPLEGNNEHFFLASEYLYINVSKTKTLYSLDFNSLTLAPISYTGTIAQLNPESLQYLGTFEDFPLFSVINNYK